MKLEKIYTHKFAPRDDIYSIALSKDYVVTNYNYEGICVFDKKGMLLKIISLSNIWIDYIFTHSTHNTICFYCAKSASFKLLDIDTQGITTIPLPSSILFDDHELLPFYYWNNTTIITQKWDGPLFFIDTDKATVGKITLDDVKSISEDFYYALQYRTSHIPDQETININAEKNQLIYFDKNASTLGILNIHTHNEYHAPYPSNDIHSAFFNGDSFIVIGCNAIDVVTKENSIIKSLTDITRGRFCRGIFTDAFDIIAIEESFEPDTGSSLIRISLQ